MGNNFKATGPIQIGTEQGFAVVEATSPLTRLNYFDGKFLRAPDLQSEQRAFLAQVQLANQAGGAGLIHGLTCTLGSGDLMDISAGLGFDRSGRPILLTQGVSVGVGELIAASAGAQARLTAAGATTGRTHTGFGPCTIAAAPQGPGTILDATTFYLVTAHHLEAYCGEEDVFGKLCSEACVSSTQRSHVVEGVTFRATPITLELKQSSLPFTGCHLRNRAASALFALERRALAPLVNDHGVLSPLWCHGASPFAGDGVPLALLGRSGGTTAFLDVWAARRERIDTPPKQYWAARMAMRSTRIYWAQVFQFQCQLECCLADAAEEPTGPVDNGPCGPQRALLRGAADQMRKLLTYYAATAKALPGSLEPGGPLDAPFDVKALEAQIGEIAAAGASGPSDRVLVDCGIVEVPSAGYLPVAPSSEITVNDQVRALLGPGVDLRFCIVRPDFVPHALEEAHHMERICLISGIEDPTAKPEVDVLVPNGAILERLQPASGIGHRADVALSESLLRIGRPTAQKKRVLTRQPVSGAERLVMVDRNISGATTLELPRAGGCARTEIRTGGGFAFYMAASSDAAAVPARPTKGSIKFGLWTEVELRTDPFAAKPNNRVQVHIGFIAAGGQAGGGAGFEQRNLDGDIRIEKVVAIDGGTEVSGRMAVSGLWRSAQIDDGGIDVSAEIVPVSADVILRRTQRAGLPPDISLTMSRVSLFANLPNVRIVLERRWRDATEQEVRLLVRAESREIRDVIVLGEASKETPLLEVRLARDGAVLLPGNVRHEAALTAISDIAEATDSPEFAESAASLLFPPPVAPKPALEIRATLPWVLFHRRRTKTCESMPPETPPVPARSYRLYNVAIGDDFTAEELREAIARDLDPLLVKYPPKADGIVSFSPGLPILESPQTDLRTDWSAVTDTTAELVYGLIASQGPVLEEGTVLAETRLKAVTTVLAPVTPLASGYGAEARSSVPGAAGTASLDGAILLFTRSVLALCHAVYLVPTRQAESTLARLESYFADPGSTTLTAAIKALDGQLLSARPRFLRDAADYLTPNEGAQVTASWNLAGGSTATQALSVSSETDDAAQVVAVEQSARIAASTGQRLDLNLENHRTLDAGLMDQCARATILIAQSDCLSVALDVVNGSVNAAAGRLARQIRDTGLSPSIFTREDNWQLLGEAGFETGTRVHDGPSLDSLIDAWKQRSRSLNVEDIRVIAVARSEEDAELGAARARLVMEAFGLETEPPDLAIHAADAPFPVACRGLTILVANTLLI